MQPKLLPFSTCVAIVFQYQILILNIFRSSAGAFHLTAFNQALFGEAGGACAVNPAAPNLQGFGVCVFVCVCLWDKERVCYVYRLTALSF